MSMLLVADPNQRSSVREVSNHPWLVEKNSRDKWLLDDVTGGRCDGCENIPSNPVTWGGMIWRESH